MTNYSAPRLVKASFFWSMFVGGGTLFWWLFEYRASPITPIVILVLLWHGGLLFSWFWAGTFARSVRIEDKIWHVVLWNNGKMQFTPQDIREVNKRQYIGFQEAIIKTKINQTVRFTDHMKGFNEVLALAHAAMSHQDQVSST